MHIHLLIRGLNRWHDNKKSIESDIESGDDLKCTAGHCSGKHQLYMEQDTLYQTCLSYADNGLDWATRLVSLAQRKSGSALQYNETLAWSRREVGWSTIMTLEKGRKAKIENKTHRNAVDLVYSLVGSISWSFSSTFLSKSNIDRTDAAASVRVEWARCLPGQILPQRWWH